MAFFTGNDEPSEIAQMKREAEEAEKERKRMKIKVHTAFDAGWAKGQIGDTLEMEPERAALLKQWCEPLGDEKPKAAAPQNRMVSGEGHVGPGKK